MERNESINIDYNPSFSSISYDARNILCKHALEKRNEEKNKIPMRDMASEWFLAISRTDCSNRYQSTTNARWQIDESLKCIVLWRREKSCTPTTIGVDKGDALANRTHLSVLLTSRWHSCVFVTSVRYDLRHYDKYNFRAHATDYFTLCQPRLTLMIFIYSHFLFYARLYYYECINRAFCLSMQTHSCLRVFRNNSNNFSFILLIKLWDVLSCCWHIFRFNIRFYFTCKYDKKIWVISYGIWSLDLINCKIIAYFNYFFIWLFLSDYIAPRHSINGNFHAKRLIMSMYRHRSAN